MVGESRDADPPSRGFGAARREKRRTEDGDWYSVGKSFNENVTPGAAMEQAVQAGGPSSLNLAFFRPRRSELTMRLSSGAGA